MSRDLPIAETDMWDEADATPRSALDRPVELPLAAGRWMVVAGAVIVAGFLRLLDLNRWPLSVSESEIALTAHNLVNGGDVPSGLLGMPTTIEWVALFLFGGGSTEQLARISMAVVGILTVVAIARFGHWLGATAACCAAILVATSPTLVAVSRRVDGGALVVALSLSVIGCLLLAREHSGLVWPALAGVSTALLALADPLGIPAVILAWLAVYLVARPSRLPGRDSLLAGLAAGIGALVLVSTVFLSHPGSFSASIEKNLSLLWNDYFTNAGDEFYMPAFNLILNEPLLILLAIVALKASHRRTMCRAVGVWTVETLILVSILGDVGIVGYAMSVLPLAVLAALGAAHLVERIDWQAFRRGPAALFVIAVILAGAAALALFGMISSGAGNDRAAWLLQFALVIAVGVLPLALAISWLGQRVPGDRGVLVLLAVVCILGAISVRSTVLAASDRPGLPGEPLAEGATGADIPIVVGRLERLSRDTTDNTRNSQDPGGGHGLHIAVDSAIAQPFEWYFRDYPNFTTFDATSEAPPADALIVLLEGSRDPRAVAPAYRGQNYLYKYDTPEFYQSPDWGSMVSGVFHPSDWRTFAGFMLDRKFATPPDQIDFQLLATPDLAAQLFPTAGPFSLDDRPGAGSGEGQFNRPRGIAVAPDGSIYVVDSRNVRVEKFDANGAFVAQFGGDGAGPGQFAKFPGEGGGGPGGVAVGSDGRVYVADTWNHRIQVFTADGAFLFSWGSFFDAQDDPNASQASPGQFYGPRGIAIHDDLVYVTDTGNERVQVFTPEGEFVRMFGLTGSGDGQLLEPVGIAVADDGTVLVADSHNSRIARFTLEGEPLDPWPVVEWANLRFFEPYLALGSDGTLYATSSSLGTIAVINPDGVALPSLEAVELRQPFGIAATQAGDQLLVTDSTINAVVRVPIVR